MFEPQPTPGGNPRLAIANCPWLAGPGAVANFQRTLRWAVAQPQGSARSPPLYGAWQKPNSYGIARFSSKRLASARRSPLLTPTTPCAPPTLPPLLPSPASDIGTGKVIRRVLRPRFTAAGGYHLYQRMWMPRRKPRKKRGFTLLGVLSHR